MIECYIPPLNDRVSMIIYTHITIHISKSRSLMQMLKTMSSVSLTSTPLTIPPRPLELALVKFSYSLHDYKHHLTLMRHD